MDQSAMVISGAAKANGEWIEGQGHSPEQAHADWSAKAGEPWPFKEHTDAEWEAHAQAERLNEVYRERNLLVAALARHYPSYVHYAEGLWPIVYVETPAGQLSWHVPPEELVEPLGLDVLPVRENVLWDGHNTEEKYARLAKLPVVCSVCRLPRELCDPGCHGRSPLHTVTP